MTHYELLQISETASPEVIRAAYMALAKKYHPDLCSDNPTQAEDKMKQINAAYETLSDPIKRRNYDLQLRIQRTRQSTYQSNTSQYSQYQSNTNENSQDQSHHQTYTRPQSDTQPPKKEPKKKKITKWLLSVLYIAFAISLVAVPLYIYYYSADNTSSTPISEPLTGKILEGYEHSNASSVTVVAPKNESCVVTLKDTKQNTIISFYVRAGETATVGIPCQTLYAFFMSGKTWYGTEDLFGDKTAYRADSTGREFDKYTYKYTVYPKAAPSVVVVNNLKQTPTQSTQPTNPVKPTLTPVSEPFTGTILEGFERYNASEITVTASKSESCVVKLKNSYGTTVLSFYVRAGQTTTVGVPAQSLYVYFASGKTWYGKEDLFGAGTSYSKDDDLLDFKSYTWSYTLYPVTDGNFSETPIDADEFFD